jgi:acyl-CoA synthetase (AMP-forming)/AMP-acid ligase II
VSGSAAGEARNLDGISHVLFTAGVCEPAAAVLVAAEPFVGALNWYVESSGLCRADRVALLGGLGEDSFLRDLCAPLLAGGTLVMPPPELAPLLAGVPEVEPTVGEFAVGPGRLFALLRDERITVLHATPTLCDAIVSGRPSPRLSTRSSTQPMTRPSTQPMATSSVGPSTRPSNGASMSGPGRSTPPLPTLEGPGGGSEPVELGLYHLRLVVSSGAPLTAGGVRALREVTNAAVINIYAAAEAPQLASVQLVAAAGDHIPAALADQCVLPIGSGVAGVRLAVVDPTGSPLPVGHVGEVVVCSPYLATGYLDGVRSGRLDAVTGTFRTGDRGRLHPSGSIVLDGRWNRSLHRTSAASSNKDLRR